MFLDNFLIRPTRRTHHNASFPYIYLFVDRFASFGNQSQGRVPTKTAYPTRHGHFGGLWNKRRRAIHRRRISIGRSRHSFNNIFGSGASSFQPVCRRAICLFGLLGRFQVFCRRRVDSFWRRLSRTPNSRRRQQLLVPFDRLCLSQQCRATRGASQRLELSGRRGPDKIFLLSEPHQIFH